MKNIKQINGVPCVLGKVYIITTEDKAQIHSNVDDVSKFTYSFKNDIMICAKKEMQRHHLYIITDEPPKDGEWCINPIGFPEIFGYDYRAVYSKEEILNCRKIIATSDSSIELNKCNDSIVEASIKKSLPQISQQFIEEYCNKGGIDNVMVVYEENTYSDGINEMVDGFKLKLDTNNCITIHYIVQKIYTQEDMLHAFQQGFNDSENELYCRADVVRNFKKWIKKYGMD